ncbi:MAG: hypothetical protein AAF604_18705 [Acidobacteriota bacterium]
MESAKTPSGAPVTVGRYLSLVEAQLARSALEGSGVPAWIPEEQMGGVHWQLGVALGGIRLQVAATDSEAAEKLLASHGEEAGAAVDEATDTAFEVCPRCGCQDYYSVPQKRRAAGLTMLPLPGLLLLIPAILAYFKLQSPFLVCRQCGHRWEERKPVPVPD